jgi:hypothetical protein
VVVLAAEVTALAVAVSEVTALAVAVSEAAGSRWATAVSATVVSATAVSTTVVSRAVALVEGFMLMAATLNTAIAIRTLPVRLLRLLVGDNTARAVRSVTRGALPRSDLVGELFAPSDVCARSSRRGTQRGKSHG